MSCHSMQANALILQLHSPAYYLANFLLTLISPQDVKHWSLTSICEKLIRVDAKMVHHAR